MSKTLLVGEEMECLFAVLLLSWLAGLARACAGDDDCQDLTSPHSGYRLFSTRTAYKEVRTKNSKISQIKGCTPKAVYMLIRHGTRYPAKDEVIDMNRFLPAIAEQATVQPGPGHICPIALDKMKSWSNPFNNDDDLKLAPKGLQEMENLACRWKQSFPDLFKFTEDFSNIDMQYTDNWRSVLSSKHFLSGISLPENQGAIFQNQYGYSVPRLEDKKLLHCDVCYEYISQKLNKTDQEKIETSLFDSSHHITWMIEEVTKYLGLPTGTLTFKAIKTMFEACRFGYAVYDDSTWCEALPTDVLRLLEYRQDMKYYWRYGHGQSINYQPSCLIIQDILQSFQKVRENAVNYNRTILRFGHSRSILPLLVRLGLYNDSEALRANNYHLHQNRKWQLAKINPFSSNVAFVLSQCGTKLYMRTFLNENEIQLPGSTDNVSSLDDIESHWKSMIGQCDFDEMCRQNANYNFSIKDIHQNHFHHV